MIFDAVEETYTVFSANFATLYAGLATAKGVTNLGTVTILKRQDAPTALQFGGGTNLPILGLYGTKAKTQARNQSRRHNLVTVVADFYIRGTDPVLIGQQTDLVPEAVLGCVDLLAGAGMGLYGGGEQPAAVSVELTMGYDPSVSASYDRRAVITFLVNQLDQGV